MAVRWHSLQAQVYEGVESSDGLQAFATDRFREWQTARKGGGACNFSLLGKKGVFVDLWGNPSFGNITILLIEFGSQFEESFRFSLALPLSFGEIWLLLGILKLWQLMHLLGVLEPHHVNSHHQRWVNLDGFLSGGVSTVINITNLEPVLSVQKWPQCLRTAGRLSGHLSKSRPGVPDSRSGSLKQNRPVMFSFRSPLRLWINSGKFVEDIDGSGLRLFPF